MARTEQVVNGLVVKQKEQGGQVILPNKSVSIDQLTDEVAFGLIPVGAVIPIMTHLAGALTPGLPGVVTSGLMLCDGSAIPGGNTLAGTTPNMSNDAYLRGSTAAGNAGGANAKALNTPQLPSHAHAVTVDTASAPHGHSASSGTDDAPHGHTAVGNTANATHNTPAGGVPTANAPVRSPSQVRLTEGPWVASSPSGPDSWAMNAIISPIGTYYAPHGHSASPNGLVNAPHGHPVTVVANNAPHSHTVTVVANNAPHSHTGSIGTTGIGDSINFEPNYVTCVYMIRVR